MQNRFGFSRLRSGLILSLAGSLLCAGYLATGGVARAADAVGQQPAAAGAASSSSKSAINTVIADAPVNTAALLVVPNAAKFSQHLALSADASGMAFPVLADSLAQLKNAFGIGRGMVDDGPVMIVFPASRAGLFGSAQSGQTLAYFPVNNYVEFLSNYGGNPNELTTSVKLPREFKGFCRRMNNHAVFGSQKPILDAMVSPASGATIVDSLGPKGGELLYKSDFSLVFNMAMAKPQMLAWIDNHIAQLKSDREKLPREARPGHAGGMVGRIVAYQALRQTISDATGIIISGNFQAHGIKVDVSVQVAAGSETAGMLKNGKDSTPLLSLLPTEIYVSAKDMDFDSFRTDALIELAVKQFSPMVEDPFTAMLVRLLPVLKHASGVGVTYNKLPSATGFGNSEICMMVFKSKDPAAFRQTFQAQLESLSKDPLPGLVSQNLPFTTAYSKNHLVIDDLPVDQYEVRTNAGRNVLDAGRDVQLLQTLASTGISGYVCAGSDFVIVTTVPDAAMIRGAIASIRRRSGTGDSRAVRYARTNMPIGPSAEFLANSIALLPTINGLRESFKFEKLKELPITSPLGLSVSVTPTNITVSGFLGTDLARVIYIGSTQENPAASAAPVESQEQPAAGPAQPAPQPDMPQMPDPGMMDPNMPPPPPPQ